jgi:hypothetical protein
MTGQIVFAVVLIAAGVGLPPPPWAAAGRPVGPVPRSIWLYEADPAPLPLLDALVGEVLDNIRPANRLAMADAEVRIHVIPHNGHLTDLPEWADLKGQNLPDPNLSDSMPEWRNYDDLRALGPATCVSGPLDLAIAVEQIVAVPNDPFPQPEPGDLGKNLVHEMGHAIECGLLPAQQDALNADYAAAQQRPLDDVVGDLPSYTAGTVHEYFAEGVVAWFEAAQGPSYRRAWLAQHDPALRDLLADVFTQPPPRRWCDGRVATTVLDEPSDFTGTPGDDVIVGSSGGDIINGAGGDDVICGGDGDDTLYGGYGDDRIHGGAGNDTGLGGSGDDVLADETAKDPGGGDDTMDGGPGDDRLDGGTGHDTLSDGQGRDTLVGGPDDDELDGRDTPATVGQSDTLDGSQGNDRCEHDADDTIKVCHPPEPPPSTTTTSTVPVVPDLTLPTVPLVPTTMVATTVPPTSVPTTVVSSSTVPPPPPTTTIAARPTN